VSDCGFISSIMLLRSSITVPDLKCLPAGACLQTVGTRGRWDHRRVWGRFTDLTQSSHVEVDTVPDEGYI